MLRAGAAPPDADGQRASTSATQSTDPSADLSTDWPALFNTLNEYLLLEGKFQPKLNLPEHSEAGEVSRGARDGAAHVLRCLKVWFDLPTDVFLYAVNLFDRFLTKMKVRPCHVPCITLACMNLAIDEHATSTNSPRTVSVEELVQISQSTCTARDVRRMTSIVGDKLGAAPRPITIASWARLLQSLLCVAPNGTLLPRLEVLLCHAAAADARPCELALLLICRQLENPDDRLRELVVWLQAHCGMQASRLAAVSELVEQVLERYEAPSPAPRQRLVWRLSERTLRVLRPTERLTSLLPTIEEPRAEETDWPCSPVLPIYCPE